MVSHVQAEPAELVAQLVDGPKQLVRLLGVGVALDVPFAIEQKALQMVHLRDGSNLVGPAIRDPTTPVDMFSIGKGRLAFGGAGIVVSKSIWGVCGQRGTARRAVTRGSSSIRGKIIPSRVGCV